MAFLLFALAVPAPAQFTANYQTNTVSGGLTGWTGNYIVGSNKVFDVVQVTGGGVLTNANGYLGYEATASNNLAVVDGGGSVWSNVGTLAVGNKGSGNQLVIVNGGQVFSTSIGYIGVSGGPSNNLVTVTGTGSKWTVGSGYLYVGQNGFGNKLNILDGGQVFVTGSGVIGQSGSSISNIMVVSGANSLWTNSANLYVGGNSSATASPPGPSQNMLVITNGGGVRSLGGIIGNSSNANLNLALVSGTGSFWNAGAGSAFSLGYFGSGNRLVISNGGMVVSANSQLGVNVASTNNEALITGAGSLWQVAGFVVGSNATGKGSGRVLVTDGGILQASTLVAGFDGTGVITNFGGVFQFTSLTPTITPNGFGNIVVTNGTISYTALTTADVFANTTGRLTNILFQGNNTFRLNTASNTSAAISQNYTFDSGISPSNYVGLEMINGGTAWKSATLAIGSGGTMLVSNTTASVAGVLTNAGTIRVANSTATWQSNVVLSAGSYTFAGATNTFSAGLQIGSAALFGGSGRVVNNGTVTNAGILSPGNSPGTIAFSSNLTLLGSSELRLEIGSDGLSYDRLVVEGVLSKGGTVLVTNLGYSFVGGETFDFLDATNWAGSFSLLTLPTLAGGMSWNTSLFEGQGIVSVVAIPEPSILWGVGSALGALVLLRRRAIS